MRINERDGTQIATPERSALIDCLKGIAMLLVVVGHCIQCGQGGEYQQQTQFFSNGLFIAIYSFHMPCLGLISGYLHGRSSHKHKATDLIWTRFIRLIVPIFAWSALIPVYHLIRSGLTWAVLWTELVNYLSSCLTGYWFLWAIFLSSIVVAAVKNKWYIALIILIAFITPDSYNFGCYKFILFFYLTGVWYAGNGDRIQQWYRWQTNGRRWLIFAITATLWAIMLTRYGYDMYIYTTGISLISERAWYYQLYIDIFRFVIGLIGSVTFAVLTDILLRCFNSCKPRFLPMIAKNSIGIYLISIYLNVVLEKLTAGYQFSWFGVIAEAAAIIIICQLIITFISRMGVIKKLFLGEWRNERKSASSVS